MKKYLTAIIGGGFSGLCLGVILGERHHDNILILEGNKRIGKKILATGNGQGNITNVNMDKKYYHGDKNFASIALEKYNNTHLLSFFNKLGLITSVNNNKVYPASFQSGAILDVLRFKLDDLSVTIETENYVTEITKKDMFEIKCSNGNKFWAENVVLAFGGNSGAGFLTDGKSYKLAENFGHKLTKLSPSLVQLKTEREKLKGLKGIKIDAKVGLYSDKQHICTFDGDLLFTDYGVSGNSIFSLSAYLKGVCNPILKIEFVPQFSREELIEKLRAKANNISVERLLISLLPTRLIQTIIKCSGLNFEDRANDKNIIKLVDNIKNFTLKVEGPAGFESSQVTAGGIDCKDILPTMESKLVKNLYIIGEALNVDGDCGGYNLQWAFTSASVCGEAINEKNKRN